MYGRSGELRRFCESRNLAYVAVVPCDFRVTLPSGSVIRADQAVNDAVFERRSCGNGSKGPRFADWALTATASPRHVLLIRRLISRPDQLTFYLCWAPPGQPATMTYFITIAGRRWSADVLEGFGDLVARCAKQDAPMPGLPAVGCQSQRLEQVRGIGLGKAESARQVALGP
ncbi:MAG: hypothetical protein ACRDPY_00620 [Streptosporangiaceae bacterium]